MAGLAARAQGRIGGRPTVMNPDKLAAARARRASGTTPHRTRIAVFSRRRFRGPGAFLAGPVGVGAREPSGRAPPSIPGTYRSAQARLSTGVEVHQVAEIQALGLAGLGAESLVPRGSRSRIRGDGGVSRVDAYGWARSSLQLTGQETSGTPQAGMFSRFFGDGTAGIVSVMGHHSCDNCSVAV